jgi:hypothetical protein
VGAVTYPTEGDVAGLLGEAFDGHAQDRGCGALIEVRRIEEERRSSGAYLGRLAFSAGARGSAR